MALSRITSAKLHGDIVDVAGPFELTAEERKTVVPLIVHVVLVQGASYAHGQSRPRDGADDATWVVHAECAGSFKVGEPTRGFGFASMVDEGAPGSPARHDVLLWSEPVTITQAP